MSSPVNYNEVAKDLGYEFGLKCYTFVGLAHIASLALFIIGCIGAAGAFPGSGSTMGWVTVGLALGTFALYLAYGKLKERKHELIVFGLIAAALVTVGALGSASILSTAQVGWGIIGTTLAVIPLQCGLISLKARQIMHHFQ